MAKADLNCRENIEKLVRTFYGRVQQDDFIGPFFNGIITSDAAWEKHYDLLVAFWEQNLLGKPGFTGNPARAHHGVDQHFKNSITAEHFDRWVTIWTKTIDELFEGEMAEKAKAKAAGMAKGMYKKVLDKRPGGFILPGGASGLSFG